MLNIVDHVPEGLLDCEAADLYRILAGPTLMHLDGSQQQPLFVSVLLHGNEDTGWLAIRDMLKNYAGRELPRSLSVFIGNVRAARFFERFTEGQPDYNRIWEDDDATKNLPERQMMREVVAAMKARNVFASIDVHNNTGLNPHYACVRSLQSSHLHLATLFSRTVVYFMTPSGVQTAPFSSMCPSVTVECGQPGQAHGVDHAKEFIEAAMRLSEFPHHAVAPRDVDLFHTVAITKVPDNVSFGFEGRDCDIRFLDDLDHLNFRELPAGTVLGWVRDGSGAFVDVYDDAGVQVADRFFEVEGDELRTKRPLMPSMLTVSSTAIRKDCLCYLMERYPLNQIEG